MLGDPQDLVDTFRPTIEDQVVEGVVYWSLSTDDVQPVKQEVNMLNIMV